MLASPLCLLILFLSGLAAAHPSRRRDAAGNCLWEEIIEVEEVIIADVSTSTISTWLTTFTVDQLPTGWASDGYYEGSKTGEHAHRHHHTTHAGPAKTNPAKASEKSTAGCGLDSCTGNGDTGKKTLSASPDVSRTLPPSNQISNIPKTHSTDKEEKPSRSEATKPTSTKKSGNGDNSPKSSTLSTATASSSSTSESSTTSPKGKYPFSAVVTFGDNLSDNGNGSYAHKVTSKPGVDNKVYGYGTWTDHQVAVSYLTDLLGVPMNQDFAFGHAWGGSSSGATVDDTLWHSNFSSSLAEGPYFPTEFSSPCWDAPSTKVQIADYIASGVNKEALHFLWIGNNDVNMATFYQGRSFASAYASKVAEQVQTLLDAGCPYVFVANIYPKHLAPVVPNYFPGWTTQESWDTFGTFINSANTALQAALTKLDTRKVIYYDAFSYMTSLWNDGAAQGYTNKQDTNGWPAFCDGDKYMTAEVEAAIKVGSIKDASAQNNWGVCVEEGKWAEWFWMQYLDMTSATHQFVAGDMERRIEEHFAE